MHGLCAWLIFLKTSATHVPQVYPRKPVVQASCTLLFFVAVVSLDKIFSNNTAQSVLISTPSHLPFPASLLKSITHHLPTNYNSIAASQLSSESD